MSTTNDALEQAIDYLGAVNVREDAGLTALGQSIAPALYAYKDESRPVWNVTTAEALRALAPTIGTEEAYATWCEAGYAGAEMPAWWTPERRSTCTLALANEHDCSYMEGFACERITADLETGAEVPA